METVNSLASAASRAIWGDSTTGKTNENETGGTEPISGQTGDVKSGEPYDKGNMDPTTTEPTTSTSDNPVSASTEPSNPKTSEVVGNSPITMPIRSEHETDKTGVTSMHNSTSATSSAPPTSSNDTSDTGPTPSVGADPSSAQQPTQKQQGADRPHEEPGSEESERIRETKKEAEDAAKVDTSGPGPKPLEEKAKEGGASGVEGDDDGPQKESHGEGTGEKWVKTSGMQADGGDFDATKPGAGKEADRLLEEKGVHREQPGQSTPSKKDDSADTPTKEKKSLKEKIKAKLHMDKDKE